MASGSGNSGKIVAGCSCLSMVTFLLVIVLINFGLAPLMTQFPDMAALWGFLGGIGAWISYACCCVSGVGMVVGIAMLLMAGKNEEEV